MEFKSEVALLAAGSYWDLRQDRITPTRDESNRAPLPPGWTLLPGYDRSGSGPNAGGSGDGFSARVYKNADGHVVISFAGTEFGATLSGFVADFLAGNIPLAVGKYGAQALAAAKLYMQVRAEHGDNISFTGHSLGGGLASVMAV